MVIPYRDIFTKLQKEKSTNPDHVNETVCETLHFLENLLVLQKKVLLPPTLGRLLRSHFTPRYRSLQIVETRGALNTSLKKENMTNEKKFSIALSFFNAACIHFWYVQPYGKPLHSNFNSQPVHNYMFKVNKRNTRKRCEICSKLTIKAPEQRHWRHFGVFTVNFEYISHLILVLSLLTLSR